MTSKKKKVFILAGMVALLVLTGVLNIVLSNVAKADDVGGGLDYSNFFASYRQDRETSREQSYLYYSQIISSPDSSAEAKLEAEAAQLALVAAMDTEQALEGQIRGLGFEEAVVTSTTQNINVIVKCTELTTQQANQILALVIAETSVSPLNVRIYPTE